MDQSQDCKLNNSDLPLNSFNIVSSQCSASSLVSGDESFVVLWKDGDKKSSKEIYPESTSSEFIEVQSALKKESLKLEESSFANEIRLQDENDLSVDGLRNQNERKNIESAKMDQSLQLLNMEQIKNEIDTSDVISIPTLTNDLTPAELEKKVSEIVEENIRLKDTVLGNNKTMKMQYERIVKWQSDVQKVHQTHKEKIIEAKEFIERLKKENSNISRELEQLKASKKTQEEEVNFLKQALMEKEQFYQEKLSLATKNKNEKKELKETELNKNLTVENTEYKAKLICAYSKIEEYKKEIDSLQSALHSSKSEFEEAKQLATSRQQEMASIQNHLENTQVTLSEVVCSRAEAYGLIDKLNKESLELKTKLEKSQAQADEIFALKAQLELYKTDFDTEKGATAAIKIEKQKLSEDFQNLQKKNQQLQQKIKYICDNNYIVPRSQNESTSSKPPPSPDDQCFLQ